MNGNTLAGLDRYTEDELDRALACCEIAEHEVIPFYADPWDNDLDEDAVPLGWFEGYE